MMQPCPPAELFAEAQRYRDWFGWSVIPTANKLPAIKNWKHLQDETPDEKAFRGMFAGRKFDGLAVIGGKPSGSLAILDFDHPRQFEAWGARYPAAKMLPTSKTGRGFHAFLRTAEPIKTTRFAFGEIRGRGGYACLPPSWHHGQKRFYRWLRHPGEKIPAIDLEDAGIPQTALATPAKDPAAVPNNTFRPLFDLGQKKTAIQEAIFATQPSGFGQRHQLLFDLARRLKTIAPSLTDPDLEAIAVRWHALALPRIRTKELQPTIKRLVAAYRDVQTPFGSSWEAAVAAPAAVSPEMVLMFDSSLQSRTAAKLAKMASLCNALASQTPDRSFQLSARKAKEVLELGSADKAWRLARTLERLGLIEQVAIGVWDGKQSGIATRWRWIGPVQ